MPVLQSQNLPLSIVGSNKFGRYKKISDESTYNMFISDEWLVNYAGYKAKLEIKDNGKNRGIFYSTRNNIILTVIDNGLYKVETDFSNKNFVGNLQTTSGNVYFDENLAGQICIVDGLHAYIYFISSGVLTQQTLTITGAGYDVIPGYVSYHNEFFLISSAPNSPFPQNWYAFEFDTNDTIKFVLKSQFPIQTKPDKALAVLRIPGKGNNVLVLGSIVAEVWQHVGGIENYRRISSFNIDSGVVSTSTIAASDQYLCYLARNTSNSSFILLTNGSESKRISTDGIDELLAGVTKPSDSTAFFYRQDGHLFYQLTFFNSADNFSLIYDFNTDAFFYITDEKLDYHPAKEVIFVDNKTYFTSLNDGVLFLMDTDLLGADYSTASGNQGKIIPRVRITNTIRNPVNEKFRVGEFGFIMEQGMPGSNNTIKPEVNISFSKDGNQTYSSVLSKELNSTGKFRNKLRVFRLGGNCNEFTVQIRFFGFVRFVANNGYVSIF